MLNMGRVNKSDGTFTSKVAGDDETYQLSQHTAAMIVEAEFRYNFDSAQTIINLGWDRQDLLDAIDFWKTNNLNDGLSILEENLDKYLNEAIIREIIV